MGSIHPAIIVSLGFCFILLLYVVLEEYMGGMIKRGVLGCTAMVVVNYMVPSYIALSFSIMTVGIALVFGIPGVIVMYLLKFLGI